MLNSAMISVPVKDEREFLILLLGPHAVHHTVLYWAKMTGLIKKVGDLTEHMPHVPQGIYSHHGGTSLSVAKQYRPEDWLYQNCFTLQHFTSSTEGCSHSLLLQNKSVNICSLKFRDQTAWIASMQTQFVGKGSKKIRYCSGNG